MKTPTSRWWYRLIAIAVPLQMLAACSNNQDFAGDNAHKVASTSDGNPDTANNDKANSASSNGQDSSSSSSSSSSNSPSSSSSSAAGGPGSSSNLGQQANGSEDIPDSAIVKGSFTAWTEPSNPLPDQDYRIFIEVRLPNEVSTYDEQDLSGRVIGTDGYRRGIGRDSQGALGDKALPAWMVKPGSKVEKDQFKLTGRSARLRVWVPGAAKLVRDTIQIRSELLNEAQDLVIIFQ